MAPRVTRSGELGGFSLKDLLGRGEGSKATITTADSRPVFGGGITTSIDPSNPGSANTTLKPRNALRMAANPATRNSLKALGNVTRLAGPTSVGVLGLLSALGELSDDDPGETKGKNIADAAGMGLGSAGGAVIGGILGGLTPLGPLGALGGSYLGSMLLGQAGKAATGGLYDLFDDRDARIQQEAIKRAQLEMGLQRDALMMLKDIQRLEADDRLQRANEANFYNTANQAVINSQAMNNNLMNNIQGLL